MDLEMGDAKESSLPTSDMWNVVALDTAVDFSLRYLTAIWIDNTMKLQWNYRYSVSLRYT